MRYLIGFIVCCFLGCSSDPDPEALSSESFTNQIEIESTGKLTDNYIDTTENDLQIERISDTINRDFLECYNGIVLGVGTHNDSLFNSFIHNSYGLYIIESSGALPMIRKFYDIRKFSDNIEKKSINELLYHEMSEPIFEFLPKVICDTEIYDKEGCFAQEINPLIKSQIWNYANLNENEIQATETLAKSIKMTVLNTSNYTFYFSKIESKWYLTFLDMRAPCTA